MTRSTLAYLALHLLMVLLTVVVFGWTIPEVIR